MEKDWYMVEVENSTLNQHLYSGHSLNAEKKSHLGVFNTDILTFN